MRGKAQMRVSYYYRVAISAASLIMLYSAGSIGLNHIGPELLLVLLCCPCLWILWLFIAYAER
jgi:hypothetical protein